MAGKTTSPLRWIGELIPLAWIGRFRRQPLSAAPPPAAEFFNIGDRVLLVPGVKKRGASWPDPDNGIVTALSQSDEALGQAITEVLGRCRHDPGFRPPARGKGDVIDLKTHAMIGVNGARGFFSRVKYGQIRARSGTVEMFPSRKGALEKLLPVFATAGDDPSDLGAALRQTIDACRLT